MKKWILSIVAVLTISASIFAQKEETLFGKSGLGLTGAWGGSSTGVTFFDDDFAVTTGGWGGLEFGKNYFIGWGGFKTTNRFEIDDLFNDRFELNYTGLMLGYMPIAHKAIHPKVMLLTGGGRVRVPGEGSDKVLVLQPSAGVELNVMRWFRIGFDGGYRIVLDNDLLGVSDSDLSAPFAEVTFKFGFSWGKPNIRFRGQED
ncbi:MAG: hypothetical protein R2879_09400 [Saprospiraceae bacterium]